MTRSNRGALRKVVQAAGIAALRAASRLAYDPKYLRGRLFEGTNRGWGLILRCIIPQKVFGIHREVPWPMSPHVDISNYRNVEFDPEWWDIFQMFGGDFQNEAARITIGSGSYVAANVTFITQNHDPLDPDRYLAGEDIVVGRKCWIGTRAILLPGVTLGDHTVVGAGAVVTKSFPDGWCVLAGVPARRIRDLAAEEMSAWVGRSDAVNGEEEANSQSHAR